MTGRGSNLACQPARTGLLPARPGAAGGLSHAAQSDLDKLEALGLFGMLLGVREQLESSQYLSLTFDERLGLLVDREAEARDSRRLALRLKAAKLRSVQVRSGKRSGRCQLAEDQPIWTR
jgi:hypothetical protein